MPRQFKTPDYEATLNQTITLRDALPPNHLARFIVDVITQLDLSRIYTQYAPVAALPWSLVSQPQSQQAQRVSCAAKRNPIHRCAQKGNGVNRRQCERTITN